MCLFLLLLETLVFEEHPLRKYVVPQLPTLSVREYWYILDDNDPDYYAGRIMPGDTVGVWFYPMGEEFIKGASYYIAYPNTATVEVFVALLKFTPGADVTYDYSNVSGGTPGPSPLARFVFGPYETTALQGAGWIYIDFLDIVGDTQALDMKDSVFMVGYIPVVAGENLCDPPIAGDASGPPEHSLVFLQNPGSSGNPSGWYYYYSGGCFMIRTCVMTSENFPPQVSVEHRSDTYLTSSIPVSAFIQDYGAPPESSGVAWARLYWMIDYDSLTLDSTEMVLVSGDSAAGTYEGIIPGGNVGDTITYWVCAEDIQGERDPELYITRREFVIREPSPDADVLVVIDDPSYGTQTPDAISTVYPDHDPWYPDEYHGVPDSSVIFHYPTLVWISYGGGGIEKEESLLRKYLDNGRNLFYSDQDGAYPFVRTHDDTLLSPGNFLYDYLHLTEVWDDFINANTLEVKGVSGDTISSPWATESLVLGSSSILYGGMFITDGNPAEIFTYPTGEACGMRYEDPVKGYKIVFLFWPFWWIEDEEEQNILVTRVLSYLGHTVPPMVNLIPHPTTMAPLPHTITAGVKSYVGSIDSVILTWVAGGDTLRARMTNTGGEIYSGEIDGITPSWSKPIVYTVTAYGSNGDVSSKEGSYFYLAPTTNILYVNDSYYPEYFDYSFSLENLGYAHDYYEVALYGEPDSTIFRKSNYSLIIWNADMGWETILKRASSENLLSSFLEEGGKLILTSDEIMGVWANWTDETFGPGDFVYDYLGITYLHNNIGMDTIIPADDPWGLSSGNLVWSPWWYDYTDGVEIDTSRASEIYYNGNGYVVGVGKEGNEGYRAIFYTFAVSYLDSSSVDTLLSRTVDFLYGVSRKKAFFLTPGVIAGKEGNIRFEIPERTYVRLKLYNIAGRLVSTLIDRKVEAGVHEVRVKNLVPGIYIYRLEAGRYRGTGRLVVVR